MGALSGAAAMLVLLPLMRGLRRRVVWISLAGVVSVAAAFGLYLIFGTPEWSDPAHAARVARMSSTGDTAPAGDMTPGSLDDAAARLQARLAGNEGSDADWELLARTYEALGRTDAAVSARAHRVEGTLPSPGKSGSAADWADYADRLAASGGRSLQGAPADAIAEALKRDPHLPKALWLAASLSLERHDYDLALRQWQLLRAQLPAGSPDLPIIDANISETQALQSDTHSSRSEPSASTASARFSGTVEVDPRLRSAAVAGRTLFVFARAAQGGGPPLAAVRLTPASWPARFEMNQEAVMLPGASLAGIPRVYVEARLSASGAANAASGDLIGAGAWVSTQGGEVSLRLTSQRE